MEDVRIPVPEILHFSYLLHSNILCYTWSQENADYEFDSCSREKLLLTKTLL